jgi:hypothetical protein
MASSCSSFTAIKLNSKTTTDIKYFMSLIAVKLEQEEAMCGF